MSGIKNIRVSKTWPLLQRDQDQLTWENNKYVKMHIKCKKVKQYLNEKAKLQLLITEHSKLCNRFYWSHGNNYFNLLSGFCHGFPLIQLQLRWVLLSEMPTGYGSWLLKLYSYFLCCWNHVDGQLKLFSYSQDLIFDERSQKEFKGVTLP